jgi:uncharacterized membrane protein YdjX (TVP38/TMEM64 family)
MNEAAEDQVRASGQWRLVILLLAVIAPLALAKVFGLGERMGELRGWIESLGSWGPVVFALLYVAALVAMLPGSALTLAAGALFGSVVGIAVVSVGATLGASAAFLVSRYFARDAAANWLGKNEKFRQLDQLTEKHGAIIVALTRLAPVFPFNLLNYGFGLTRVPFRTYLFWSWLCMAPGTFLYVLGADPVTKGVAQGKVPWPLVGGAAVAAPVLIALVRVARRKLDDGAARKEAGNA